MKLENTIEGELFPSQYITWY